MKNYCGYTLAAPKSKAWIYNVRRQETAKESARIPAYTV